MNPKISSSLAIGQILNLIIHIIKQNTRIQLILEHWLKWQFIFITIHLKCNLLQLLRHMHSHNISPREFKCLHLKSITFIVLF